MKKNVIIAIITVSILALGGAGYVYTTNQNEKEASSLAAEKLAMDKKTESDAMAKSSETTAKTDDSMAVADTTLKSDTMVKPEQESAMTKASAYVTLANFNKDKIVYNDYKKIYFFHAPWCPICKAIDEDIVSDTSQIPTGTVFIKTDFDSNTELKQKYGVNNQYTFVQVDNNENELKQWNATTLDKAIAGIQ